MAATNQNTSAPRKIVSVEILHLDELGYGPQGLHKREDWRNECFINFAKGKQTFLQWQKKIHLQINGNLPKKSFGVVFHYDNGSKDTFEDFQVFAPYSLDFSNQTFENKVLFPDYVFEEVVFFIGTVFLSDAYFFKSIFSQKVYFEKTIIDDKADFDEVQFIETATFTSCYFSKRVYFKNSIFKQEAKFFHSIFKESADFTSTSFENESLFYNSNFYGQVNFENAKFNKVGHFEFAEFKNRTPSFRGCKISDTLLEFSGDDYFPKYEYDEVSIKNLSFLKRISEEHGQTDQALNFNAMELRAKMANAKLRFTKLPYYKRLISADWWFAKVTRGYEVFSDFGRSFTKPLKWYVILVTLSFIFAYNFLQAPFDVDVSNAELCKPKAAAKKDTQVNSQNESKNDILQLPRARAAFEYSLFRAGGVMDFTDTDKQNNAVNCALFDEPIEPWRMRLWGIFKSIASLALLFLAALGLRNKYRIK
jgi:uncharacterized protein YjbI with pentapeptide repeats